MSDTPALPTKLHEVLDNFVGKSRHDEVTRWLRDPNECMSPAALGATKASRTSFARVLARRMITQRWKIEREFFRCDAEGEGSARYAIEIGHHRLTYVVRTFGWDGVEKVGRRADGAYRDMYGAIFAGVPDQARIDRELATFDTRDAATMRTDAAVTGWAPANRSVRHFDAVVDALTAGRQPDAALIGDGGGYVMRNGGYNGSGRNGTLSYEGYPTDHPFRHPYFADLFGLYLVREVSVDLVSRIAAARNAHAPALERNIARYIGVGNSSGQGMCVALQRWPHWVATWVTVRELSIAYSKSRLISEDPDRVERLDALLSRAATYLASVRLPCEDYVVPNATIAANLLLLRKWLHQAAQPTPAGGMRFGDLVARAATTFDLETVEQFNALLIEVHPEFADAASDYLPIGAHRERDVVPEMRVGALRTLLATRYAWALNHNLSRDGAREHFWYHSSDNGEQRRGQRGVDPHEHFESFIDHIDLAQRLNDALRNYHKQDFVAEVIADAPELAYGISRVQYLADIPFAEIRGNLVAREFVPAELIRFLLATLGLECASPLSVQYVRGVFFQGMPLAEEVAHGAAQDWQFPIPPAAQPHEASPR